MVEEHMTTDRIRVLTDANEHLRARPERLASLNDASVAARTLVDALAHTRRRSTDHVNLASFVARLERGDRDGALSAAATFTLDAMRKSKGDAVEEPRLSRVASVVMSNMQLAEIGRGQGDLLLVKLRTKTMTYHQSAIARS